MRGDSSQRLHASALVQELGELDIKIVLFLDRLSCNLCAHSNLVSNKNFSEVPATYHLLTYIPTYLPTYIPTYLPTYLLTYLPTYLPTFPTYLSYLLN